MYSNIHFFHKTVKLGQKINMCVSHTSILFKTGMKVTFQNTFTRLQSFFLYSL